ncbi:MAG TPA: DinB family protein [Pyrinomonadaceae bacterium]|jgi:hypothetical protein
MKFQLAQAVEILGSTPLVLKSMLGNLSDEWTQSSDDKEDWSPYDVVGHYIHGEEADWIPRAEIILRRGENSTFEPFDRLAMFEKSEGKTLSELLETFAARRRASLEALKSWNLTDAELQLKGVHPELGAVTLEQLIATWVVHDLTHIRQIVAFLAKKYSSNVGAWKEYLSILK